MLPILSRLREPAEADLATLPVAAHDGSGSAGSAFGRPMRLVPVLVRARGWALPLQAAS